MRPLTRPCWPRDRPQRKTSDPLPPAPLPQLRENMAKQNKNKIAADAANRANANVAKKHRQRTKAEPAPAYPLDPLDRLPLQKQTALLMQAYPKRPKSKRCAMQCLSEALFDSYLQRHVPFSYILHSAKRYAREVQRYDPTLHYVPSLMNWLSQFEYFTAGWRIGGISVKSHNPISSGDMDAKLDAWRRGERPIPDDCIVAYDKLSNTTTVAPRAAPKYTLKGCHLKI